MAESSGGSAGDGTGYRPAVLEPKHKIFLSHSSTQKNFVEYLCEELERCLRYPFFDLREESLPIGENFVKHIFAAIKECYVGIVILSEEFFTSKWPMMELAAMVDEVEKRNDFKLIPVFLHTSLADFDNSKNQKRWQECWKRLAKKNPGRVEVGKWEAALKYICPLNGLEKKPGQRELEFLKQIVDRICAILPAEMRLDDSHIQGGSRLCKVIQDKIDLQEKRTSGGVCKVGLYGMGGMGKTTICKALCNEFSTKFRGRVCHAELERENEEELLRDVLKRLSNTSHELLNRSKLDELRNGLKEGAFIKEAVFLAVDNMSDTNTSIREAKGYLTAKLPVGSIVIVTTRYKEALAQLGLSMDDDCMKMPELEFEEARSLFVNSCDGRNEDNEQLIKRCVKRCHFWNDDKQGSYHYHPLALDVLGSELARLDDPKKWEEALDRIDKDIFNLSDDRDHHLIFSILRSSFDALPNNEDRLLFIDVILFLTSENLADGLIVLDLVPDLEWLGMVHEIAREDVMDRLTRLKRKSLLESIGDGSRGSIRVHDLWRAFAVAETKRGELSGRRWVYETKTCSGSSPCETSPSGSCWENVKRMAFLGSGWSSLGRVNFAHFRNVTVLKIEKWGGKENQVVDLSGLVRLRSLEIIDGHSLIVQGLPKSLIFLMVRFYADSGSGKPIAKQIRGLEELQWLELRRYAGGKLPDMRKMISLRQAKVLRCSNVVTVTGLSLALRVLDFSWCRELQSCPGLDDLVALEELSCRECEKLKSLPNLGRLRMLRKLDIRFCKLITELPGVGDLVALEELHAYECSKLSKLPDMRKLINLRVLDLKDCSSISEVPGFDSLVSLQKVKANFRAVVEKPNLRQLTKLQNVEIRGWSAAGIQGLNKLTMLHTLWIIDCSGVGELPDLQSLTRLQWVLISESEFKDLSGLRNLIALETLGISKCKMLERLPAWQRLTSLKSLEIEDCGRLSCWDCTAVEQVERRSCRSEDTSVLDVDVSGSHTESKLKRLVLGNCRLSDLSSIGGFSQLERLEIKCLPATELPDLSNFPRLKYLRLRNCERLERLKNHVPMNALSKLEIDGCSSLATIPDLAMFPALEKLHLSGCSKLSSLNSSRPLIALTEFEVESCDTLTAVPDLAMFPALKKLHLRECNMLVALSNGVPMTTLAHLEVKSCTSLVAVPDLAVFRALQRLQITYCGMLSAFTSSGPFTLLTEFEVIRCDFLVAVPDLAMFPALEKLHLSGCSKLSSLNSSRPLIALTEFEVESCDTLTAVPDLAMFPALKKLHLRECNMLVALSNGVPMTTLAHLEVKSCTSLVAVPDLAVFRALQRLQITYCGMLSAFTSSGPLTLLTEFEVIRCDFLVAVPDLAMFPALEKLHLSGCNKLRLLNSSRPLIALTEFEVESCYTLAAVLDLAMFPALKKLNLRKCNKLVELSNGVPMTTLMHLEVESCTSLVAVPDLAMFPALQRLQLTRCSKLRSLNSSGPLVALIGLLVESCDSLTAVPDLAMFPALKKLILWECNELVALSNGVPLTTLTHLQLISCSVLTAVPDLAMFPALEVLSLHGCSKLTALRSSVPLTALERLDVRECSSMSGNALVLLRASCPQCQIMGGDEDDIHEDGGREENVKRRSLLRLLELYGLWL